MKYIVSMGIIEEVKESNIYTNEEGKTYVKETCPKCNGSKIFTPWMHTYGGKCFKCDALGYISVKRKVYDTIEEAQKVANRYNKRIQKQQEKIEKNREANILKINEEDKKAVGFLKDSLYIVFCKYEEKEKVKKLGAKWNSKLSYWTVEEPLQEFDCLKINWEDVIEEYTVWEDVEAKRVEFIYSKFRKIVEAYKDSKKKYVGEWIGEEKEKLEMTVTLERIKSYKTDYGWINIYIFRDERENILTWKTSKEVTQEEGKEMNWEKGQELNIRFTIKGHEEFENEKENVIQKQTSILRVKEV